MIDRLHSHFEGVRHPLVAANNPVHHILDQVGAYGVTIFECAGAQCKEGQFMDQESALLGAEYGCHRNFVRALDRLDARVEDLGPDPGFPIMASFLVAVLPRPLEPGWARRQVAEHAVFTRFDAAAEAILGAEGDAVTYSPRFMTGAEARNGLTP